MVDMALQSALSLNINACLIHWAATDTPETRDSDSLLSACSRFVPGMRCDPLSCLILPPPEGSVRQLMRCWYVGGEGDVITFISHQVLSGIQWRRQAGPTLFHKMEISHGFYHHFIILKSIAYVALKQMHWDIYLCFCGWRKVLFPGPLMKME